MRILRFLAVMFCCAAFATASAAGSWMPCCMQQAAGQGADMPADMPCHDMGKENPPPSKYDGALTLQICKCACTMQVAAMPGAPLPLRVAQLTAFAVNVPLPLSGYHSPIENPPKHLS